MNSEFEKSLSTMIVHLRKVLLSYDRGVVFGVVLAFIPIFPACFFGVVISLVNVGLALNNRLDTRNRNAALLGVCVGAVFTVFWWHALASLSGATIASMITTFINSIFEVLLEVPAGAEPGRDGLV